MTSSHIALAADGSGKEVDTNALTSTETGEPTVHRQNISLADPTTYDNIAHIDVLGQQYVRVDLLVEPLHDILTELRLLRLTLSTIGDVFINEEVRP